MTSLNAFESADAPAATPVQEMLEQALHRLIGIDPNGDPLISCFVDVSGPRTEWMNEIKNEARMLCRTLPASKQADFTLSFTEIETYFATSLLPQTQSVAIFVRSGEEGIFLPLQFQVPMETRMMIDEIPHVYPLVELRDTYHRFLIVITTEREARILETTMGTVSCQILSQRPELRERIGREWTRERFRSHMEERERKFVKEKVAILNDLVQKRGHNHILVTGSPKMVSRFVSALPPHLSEMLIDTGSTNPNAGIDKILFEAILTFVAAENVESHDHVAKLDASVRSGGLGVAGYEAAREALASGCGDMLIIDQDFPDIEAREELVRLATASGASVETVNRSKVLARLSGVGCLLRYRPRHW